MGEASVAAYRFGEFVLNVERGCLQRNGIDLELRPKAFDLLRYLVERAGKLVPKDELVEVAWPHVAVSDDSLAQCVCDIRRLLDDDAQRYNKTVPRRGYVFVAEVDTLTGVSWLATVNETGRVPGKCRWHRRNGIGRALQRALRFRLSSLLPGRRSDRRLWLERYPRIPCGRRAPRGSGLANRASNRGTVACRSTSEPRVSSFAMPAAGPK